VVLIKFEWAIRLLIGGGRGDETTHNQVIFCIYP